MITKILSVNAGYSMGDLLSDLPWVQSELEFLGLNLQGQVPVKSQQHFIGLVQQAVEQCNVLIVIDGSEDFYTRDILAQGLNKPLQKNEQAEKAILSCLSRMSRSPSEAALSYAQIPEGAVPLTCPETIEQGFMLLYPSICIAVLPANKKAMHTLFADQFYPRLLKSLYRDSFSAMVPLKPEAVDEVEDYINRYCRHTNGFLPLVCRSRNRGGNGAVLRLTAIRSTSEESRQCCDSFLEDLASELGNVTAVSRIGTKGTRALKGKKARIQEEENSLTVLDGQPIDPYGLLIDNQTAGRKAKKEAKKMAKKSAKANRTLFDKVRSFLLFVFICVFAGSLGYLGWYYYKSAQNRADYENLREVYDSPGLTPSGYPSGYDKEFAGLWSINNDTVGWISIEGTGLDYPVVQTTDNDTYYRKNFEGNYSEHAVPFVDAAADLKAPSKNLVIYGHNIRADGQMFNILREYRDLEYYKAHPVVEFNSVYHRGKYKIFGIFYANTLAEHGPIFDYHAFINGGDAEAQQYINNVLARTIINTGVDVSPSDQFLTLSTCSYEFEGARYVVVARRVRDGESESVDTNAAAKNPNPLYPDIWYSLFGGTKPASSGAESQPASQPVSNETQEPDSSQQQAEEPEKAPAQTTPPAQEQAGEEESGGTETTEPAPEEQPEPEPDAEPAPDEPKVIAPDKEEEEPQPSEETEEPEKKEKKIIKKKSAEEDQESADASQEFIFTQTLSLQDFYAGGTVVREASDDDDSDSQNQEVKKSIRKVYSSTGELTNREETDGDVEVEDDTPAKKVIKPKSSSSSDSSSSISAGSKPSVSSPSSTAKAPSTLKIKVNGSSKSGSATQLIPGIVEAEMGASFQTEALKAQAVAIYSYICYNNNRGVIPSLPYKSPSSKAKAAVEAVLGEAVYYDGDFANTTYYASSAGVTNDSRNVWGGSLPYLVSVDSPGDTRLKAYGATKTFSVDTVASRIKSYLKVDPYDYGDPEDWFSDITYYCGKYIDTIRVCGKKINGRDVRESLLKSQINSAAFEIDCNGRQFTFTTYGYGHGVGMSQQGADYYAMQGWDYKEILTHYYPHTQVG